MFPFLESKCLPFFKPRLECEVLQRPGGDSHFLTNFGTKINEDWWFMVHRRPLTTHWACKGQVGCAIPLVAPAGRCNARMNINKNKYKSNRKLKWDRHRPQWFRQQQLSLVFLHLCQIFKANELDSASHVSDPSHLNGRFKARMEKDSIKKSPG